MEAAFLISLRYRIHSLKLNLNGCITGSTTRICLVLLMLLSLVSKQWVNALASDANVGHDFTLPLSCSVYAYSISHRGTAPGATGIEGGKAFDVGWTDTPVWIIAIGSK